MSTAYKVVCRHNSKSFEPATLAALQKIRYRIGQETVKEEGKYGPFALFATEKEARDFADSLSHRVCILMCEYTPSQETELWKCNPPSFRRYKSGKGYYAESNGTTERSIECCPNGTILADRVRPLEIVAEDI